MNELLRRALRSGIQLRGFVASVGKLDALGMLKVALCAMLGELVGENNGHADDAKAHHESQWGMKTPLAWVREAGAAGEELAAVAAQSIYRGSAARRAAWSIRRRLAAVHNWAGLARALRSREIRGVADKHTALEAVEAAEVAAAASLTVRVEQEAEEVEADEEHTVATPKRQKGKKHRKGITVAVGAVESDSTPPASPATPDIAAMASSPRVPPPAMPRDAIQALATAARCAELLAKLRASPASSSRQRLNPVAEEPAATPSAESQIVTGDTQLAENEARHVSHGQEDGGSSHVAVEAAAEDLDDDSASDAGFQTAEEQELRAFATAAWVDPDRYVVNERCFSRILLVLF